MGYLCYPKQSDIHSYSIPCALPRTHSSSSHPLQSRLLEGFYWEQLSTPTETLIWACWFPRWDYFIHLSHFLPHNLFHVSCFSHFFQSCIESKDHLNFRYFHKRALFIAIIAGHLMKKKSLFCDVKFTHDCGDHLLPIITLQPKSK